ncbi:adenylyltransferase/cytidyltransferase family protein [Colwellia sp. C1TZA3]|uniref:adenylyltransferase/cytidyltransferase family protein n=1 Tax=Colwellia sp. C1TZA3 TaxID=2508879 RepID=UPI0011B9C425|nr:adenylyltransferase/cytidyltransferase family protein [Colwellia sp. C1TZA3]TWX67629.1 adenylyltransferase/cytidyltransferase family protein [Colwellia sp. C1TZA3]
MKKILTFGTFDLFHIGHLQILKRAKALGDYLVVGVSTDALNFSKKQRNPICNQQHRMEIIQELKSVDEVFYEHSLELKRQYIIDTKADVLVMGDDWQGRFDEFNDTCEVVYLPRTPSISTTALIEIVREIT